MRFIFFYFIATYVIPIHLYVKCTKLYLAVYIKQLNILILTIINIFS